jgi:hypothetical protein
MNDLIIFLTWLDTSDMAYILMILCFIVMAMMHHTVAKENKRLRALLRKTVLED